MNLRGLGWLRSDPGEARALDELPWSKYLDAGVPVLGLVLTGIVLVAAGLGNPDPSAIGLVALSGVPWATWLLTAGRAPREAGRPPARPCVLPVAVLVPLLLLALAGWTFDVDLASPVAHQLLLFPVLLVVVHQILFRTRPVAMSIAVGGLAVHLLGARGWATQVPSIGVDWTGVIAQTVGFAFAVCAAVTVRQSNLALHRAGRALARQSAADERRRLARDVHDVIAHTLAITMLHVTAARMAVSKNDPDAAMEALTDAEQNGRVSLGDLRRVVRLLRDDPDAPTAPQPQFQDIDALVDGYRVAGLVVERTVAGDHGRLSPATSLVLYKALQEALANAARHGLGPVVVDLAVESEEVALRVENALVPGGPAPGSGSGLTGMRERVDAVAGQVEAGKVGATWVVDIRMPVDAETTSPAGPVPVDTVRTSAHPLAAVGRLGSPGRTPGSVAPRPEESG